MTEAQKQRLEQQLWKIANELRGKMGADEFRDYILGFIFYKYLSEKQHLYANKLLETESVKDYAQVTDPEDIDAIHEESLLKLGYFLRPDELFSAITAKGNANVEEESNFILEGLQTILNNVEQSTMGTDSEDDFNKLFENLDLANTRLGRSPEARNNLISKILAHLDKIDFELENADTDILGDAYEYLIAQFASGAGKKAGEFYTPQQVSKILAKIVTLDKSRIKNAYDPTCGSGSLLLRIAKEAEVGDFYGQESNPTTYNLARMNMILHDVHFSRFDIRHEDTLEHPQHLEERFEAVVANPPFSAHWKGKNNPLNETDDRFSQYGRLAPGTKADFAFVQHMIYQLAENGTMAVVLPHGVLFRGAAEAIIRQYIIKDQNYLDAVIGLPANLFYGTPIQACILIIKKCRVHDDNILFIDASQHFEKIGNKNTLTSEHVEKIIETYQKREEIDKYSHIASLDEVKENDYNLNIPRYVDTFEEEEPVDIEAVADELKALETDMLETDKTIAGFCKELGISSPFKFQGMTMIKEPKQVPELRFPEFNKKWNSQTLFGLSKNGFSNGVFNDPKKVGSGYKLINVKDMYQGDKISLEKLTLLDIPQKEFEKNKVNWGDVFFTRSSLVKEGIAHSNVFLSDDELTTYDGHLIRMSPNREQVSPQFLGYALKTDTSRRQLVTRGKTTTMTTIGQEDISSVVIVLGEREEQQKIADFLSAIDQKIKLIGKELELAQTFKKGLLQQMFI